MRAPCEAANSGAHAGAAQNLPPDLQGFAEAEVRLAPGMRGEEAMSQLRHPRHGRVEGLVRWMMHACESAVQAQAEWGAGGANLADVGRIKVDGIGLSREGAELAHDVRHRGRAGQLLRLERGHPCQDLQAPRVMTQGE